MKYEKIVVGLLLTALSAQAKKPVFVTDVKEEVRVSPVVFKFDNQSELQTVSLEKSQVMFDFNSDGGKERTGWVSGKEGFLVLDVNQNGLVDNGRELFGNHSAWGQKHYRNGYLSMQYFDINKDNYLDRQDIVFYNLKLWFDDNRNGISEGHELKTLPGMGITRISTQPQTFEESPRLGQNFIPLASRFWGPSQCGEVGCLTFDVFFLTEDLRKVQLGQR